MGRQVLNGTPTRTVTALLSSPATYPGYRQPGYARAIESVEAAQAPQEAQQVLPEHHVSPRLTRRHQCSIISKQCSSLSNQYTSKLEGFRTQDSGSLVYIRLTKKNCTRDWVAVFCSEKRFVRQIQFAERAYKFSRTEHIKVDILGHDLKGVAERYYNLFKCIWLRSARHAAAQKIWLRTTSSTTQTRPCEFRCCQD